MRMLVISLAVAVLAACAPEGSEPRREPIEVRTIDNVPPRLATLEPPPVLEDPAVTPARRPIAEPKTPAGTTTAISEQETMRAKTNLPFTPPIAMDPVDGDKLTITADTPIYSYKDRWYYFTSEANKRRFVANPEEFLDQALGRF